MDDPDTVLVREVLGRRPGDEDSEGGQDVGGESGSENDLEEESEDSEGGGTKEKALSTQNPFALLDDSS